MPANLVVDGLGKSFRSSPGLLGHWGAGGRVVVALEDVSFEVGPSEIFGVVGRNGHGKTTLLRTLGTLVEPSTGRVLLCGGDIRADGRRARALVGWAGAEERSFYLRLTGRQNLSFFARLQGVAPAALEPAIERLGRDLELESLLDRRVGEYSSGSRQRLALARAVLHSPRVLLLDEPTRSLDPVVADVVRAWVRDWVAADAKRCAVVTSHDLADVEQLCGRLALLDRGRLAGVGTLAELRRAVNGRTRVRVRVRGLADGAAVISRAGVEVSAVDAGGERAVEFWAARGDGAVDGTLRALIDGGAEIVSCHEESDGLRALIEHAGRTPS